MDQGREGEGMEWTKEGKERGWNGPRKGRRGEGMDQGREGEGMEWTKEGKERGWNGPRKGRRGDGMDQRREGEGMEWTKGRRREWNGNWMKNGGGGGGGGYSSAELQTQCVHLYITLFTSLSVTTLSSCGVDWAMATCPPELHTTAHWSKQFSSCSQERRLPFTKKDKYSWKYTNMKQIQFMQHLSCHISKVNKCHHCSGARGEREREVASGRGQGKKRGRQKSKLTISVNSVLFGGSHCSGILEYLQQDSISHNTDTTPHC